ncbi:hypothetical protein PHLCEN_2v6863 [Hermanssonia centrifuga]|uniref:CHAT domain-containing protein n=1 Tax=Hermanssonia centrifuga TaxID=98765 RepID=A0A2R6NYT5_9APHY|nr:hypothetical protein PHLCEN_2v6863 [Hermanssonia centrifuga]
MVLCVDISITKLSRPQSGEDFLVAAISHSTNGGHLVREDDPELLQPLMISQTASNPTLPSKVHHSTFAVALPNVAITTLIPPSSLSQEVPVGASRGVKLDLDLTLTTLDEFVARTIGLLLLDLAKPFFSQFSKGGDARDLERTILLQWLSAQALHGEDSDICAVALCSLVFSMECRMTLEPDQGQLDSMISIVEWGFEHCTPILAIRCSLVSIYSEVLAKGYRLYRSNTNIEQAVQRCREAFAAIEEDRTFSPVTSFRDLLLRRFEVLHSVDDIIEAVALSYEALSLCPIGDYLTQRKCYQALGNVHFRRFKALLHPADLDEAIKQLQECMKINSADFREEDKRLDLLRLATFTNERFVAWGDRKDCDESIRLLHEVVDCYSPNDHHHNRAAVLLAQNLAIRGDAEEVRPILYSHSTLQNKPIDLCKAAEILRTCFSHRTDELRFIDEAIQHSEKALTFDDDEALALKASHELGLSYAARFEATKDKNDAAAAVDILVKVVEKSASNPALRALVEMHFNPDLPSFDVSSGYRYLDALLDTDEPNPAGLLSFLTNKLLDVDASLENALGHSPNILVKISRLLPRIAHFALHVESRLSVLRTLDVFKRSFAPSAVHRLCEAGRVEDGLELLERARGVFWSQALRLRIPLEEIPATFRDRFYNLSRQIEMLSGSFAPLTWNERDPSHDTQRRRLSNEFDQLCAQARAIPGYENFLKPVSIRQRLKEIALNGPVVILFSALNCSYAIIVQLDHDGDVKFTRICCEGLAEDALQKLSTGLRSVSVAGREAIKSRRDFAESAENSSPSLEYSRGERADRPVGQRTAANTILAALWRKVVRPVISKLMLKPTNGRSRPRLWWCPTGEFMFLPVHAAGIYDGDGSSKVGECCSDYVVSSYTPTIGALISSKKTCEAIARTDLKVLLAAVPVPFKGARLRGTVSEVEQISQLLSEEERMALPPEDDTLLDPQAGATVNTILDNLRDANIFHLASHGTQIPDNSLDSGFIMRDSKLTISSLMQLPQPKGFLAFLSACETAKGDKAQSNEAMHLAATMLFVGFKSVIGTMWFMTDEDGPHVAKHVYTQLLAPKNGYLDPEAVPYALDEAVRALREKGLPPERWSLFIHFGI